MSSMPSKYFDGVMLWYTSTIGSGRDNRNAETVGSPIDAWYTSRPREPSAPNLLSGRTSLAEPGAMWRANTSEGPTRRSTSRYSSATLVMASAGDAAARI